LAILGFELRALPLLGDSVPHFPFFLAILGFELGVLPLLGRLYHLSHTSNPELLNSRCSALSCAVALHGIFFYPPTPTAHFLVNSCFFFFSFSTGVGTQGFLLASYFPT
jgi:hypothetical protein